MKKQYISELIGERFKEWNGKKVLLHAPTGAGKSTFIIKSIVPYYSNMKSKLYPQKKVLILSNRKLLQLQYEDTLLRYSEKYQEILDSSDLMTYQELAQKIKYKTNVAGLFIDYSAVVCDEAHYFYADSDFAPDTFKLLYAILYAGFSKTMIFMSATLTEVAPFIKKAWEDIYDMHRSNLYAGVDSYENPVIAMRLKNPNVTRELVIEVDLVKEDYSRFSPCIMDNYDDLAKYFAESDYKSILFIDDKEKAKSFAEKLKAKELKKGDISIIHADNIESTVNKELVHSMTVNHKLVSKVLLTTSVLDNGVSFEDPDIRNVCIVTNSKLSFIQMLGRIRECEKVDDIKLIFLKREAYEIQNYLVSYKKLVDQINEFTRNNKGIQTLRYKDGIDIMLDMLAYEENGRGSMLKKILIPCVGFPEYFNYRSIYKSLYPLGAQISFVVNHAAIAKIQDSYMQIRKLYAAAVDDPIKLVRLQMSWIGQENEKLTHLLPTSDVEKKAPMIEELIEIRNFSNEEFVDAKIKLTNKYFKKFYKDIDFRGGDSGCSTEKFKIILESVGLCLIDTVHDGKKYYSVRKKE